MHDPFTALTAPSAGHRSLRCCCQADDRVVAAVLGGSYASGQADAFSDLDLAVITTDATFDDFFSAREGFMRVLGEPLFLESFDSPITLFAIFDDGTELELSIGRESQFDGILIGPYAVLVDKRGILSGAVFTGTRPTEAEQIETLRRLVYWFWHDVSTGPIRRSSSSRARFKPASRPA